MTQVTQLGALQHPEGWDGEGNRGGSGRRGDGCTYDWFMFMFDRKQQNFVKQVSFDKKWINFKKNYLLDFLVLFLPYKSIIIYHYSQLFFAIWIIFHSFFSHGNDVQQVATGYTPVMASQALEMDSGKMPVHF